MSSLLSNGGPSLTRRSKDQHSPFVVRRFQQRSQQAAAPSPARTYPAAAQPTDGTSTSSSTLVNIDSANHYHPWEVRSDSSTSSYASSSRPGTSTPLQSNVNDPEHSTYSSSRSSRANNSPRRPARIRSQTASSKPVKTLCPDDCRCSDQELAGVICRRAAGSSSSSDSSSQSIKVHETRRSFLGQSVSERSEMLTNGRDSRSEPGPRQRVSPASRRSNASASLYKSFEELQKGLGSRVQQTDDSDGAESSEDARVRAESIARSTDRRESSYGSARDSQSVASLRYTRTRNDASPPKRRPWLSASASLSSSQSFQTPQNDSPPKTPASGRRSIAAVFESMQKEREARAAEDQRRRQQKQEQREMQRSARAAAVQTPNRSSNDATASPYPDLIQASHSSTIGRASLSAASDVTASSPRVAASVSSRVMLTPSPTFSSPRMDEAMAEDVTSRHLQDEAAARIPETLAEEAESSEKDDPSSHDGDAAEANSAGPSSIDIQKEDSAASPGLTTVETGANNLVTPQLSSGFEFASQPMALDLSPSVSGAGTLSELSSPATSPRRNAHKRSMSAVASVTARDPPATFTIAQRRLNQALSGSTDHPADITPLKYGSATRYPQTPVMGILSSTRKRLQDELSTKSRHNVRFSPRPDYRSDSGSWDESEHQVELPQLNEAPLIIQAQPVQETVIPEIVAEASKEMSVFRRDPIDHDANKEEVSFLQAPPASVTAQKSPAKKRDEEQSAPGNGSFSRSVHVPGAYIPTPAKLLVPRVATSPVSRHVIRPSPTSVRTKMLNFSSNSNANFDNWNNSPTSASSGRSPGNSPSRQRKTTLSGVEFGLYPDSHMPRESTPPPGGSFASSFRRDRRETLGAVVLSRDDPRRSPRSPRPAQITGSNNEFPLFESSPISSDDANDSVTAAINKVLSNLDSSRQARTRLGAAFGSMDDQIESALRTHRTLAVSSPTERRAEAVLPSQQETPSESDMATVHTLKEELVQALGALTARIQRGYDDITVLPSLHSTTRPRWVYAAAFVAQLSLMAFLLHVAEEKAQRMRMYTGSGYAISYPELYRPPSSAVEWTAESSSVYLMPLLRVPVLTNIASRMPLLPSTGTLNTNYHSASTIWDLYRLYIKLHGWTPFVLQCMLYTLAQVASCLCLLLFAPVHLLYYLLTI